MEVFDNISAVKAYLSSLRSRGKSIALVPTMGALHEGHLSLIRNAKTQCNITVCSIYVNPTQFNETKDFEMYPKDLEKDIDLLKANHCDVLFCPKDEEVFPEKPIIQFNTHQLGNKLEGSHRPGHFNGVCLIVSKLFNIIEPHVALFGQKDLQQFLIIQRLAKDLSFPIDVKCVDTVREPNGLALSSRNKRLTLREKEIALHFYKALIQAKSELLNKRQPKKVKESMISYFDSIKEIKLDYFEIVYSDSLENVEALNAERDISLCIAGYIGEVRLIDNMFLFS